MPKQEWGVKRLCPACSARFYDLGADPMTCPECGAVHSVEQLTSGKARTMSADKPDPKSVKADQTGGAAADGDDDEDDAAAVELDDDDDVLEDDEADDVLEDDEDDDDVSLDELADVASDEDSDDN